MDYLNKQFDSLDLDAAIQLCCIEIRRFFKDMPQIALDKKSNFEYLEKEVGLHKFLPKVILENNKIKTIRKLVQQHFKKYAALGDRECMLKFFEVLKTIYRFDQETFQCSLGVINKLNDLISCFCIVLFKYQAGWSIAVQLVIGSQQGIGYKTDAAANVLSI